MRIWPLAAAFALAFQVPVSRADQTEWPNWSVGANMPVAVQEIYPVVLDGKIFTAGGFGKSGAVAATMMFDAALGRWTNGPDLPRPTHHVQMVTHGGSVLVIGGYTISGDKVWNMNGEVHRLAKGSGSWVPAPSLLEPRAETVAGTIDGTAIVAGGRTLRGTETGEREDHKEATDTLVLRPGKDKWDRVAPIPTPRMSGAGAVLSGRLHVLGGRVHTGVGISYDMLDTHEAYDPVTDRWHTLAPLPQPVAGIAAATLSEKLCVFGGEDDKPPYAVFDFLWCYDSGADMWSDLGPMPAPLHGHGAVTLGDKIHIFGGSTLAGGTGTQDRHATFKFLE